MHIAWPPSQYHAGFGAQNNITSTETVAIDPSNSISFDMLDIFSPEMTRAWRHDTLWSGPISFLLQRTGLVGNLDRTSYLPRMVEECMLTRSEKKNPMSATTL